MSRGRLSYTTPWDTIENNEREDLSFIEKARFAHQLNKQFPREIVIAAMSVDKSNLSKMLLLVNCVPEIEPVKKADKWKIFRDTSVPYEKLGFSPAAPLFSMLS
jgi:hypothetical protein